MPYHFNDIPATPGWLEAYTPFDALRVTIATAGALLYGAVRSTQIRAEGEAGVTGIRATTESVVAGGSLLIALGNYGLIIRHKLYSNAVNAYIGKLKEEGLLPKDVVFTTIEDWKNNPQLQAVWQQDVALQKEGNEKLDALVTNVIDRVERSGVVLPSKWSLWKGGALTKEAVETSIREEIISAYQETKRASSYLNPSNLMDIVDRGNLADTIVAEIVNLQDKLPNFSTLIENSLAQQRSASVANRPSNSAEVGNDFHVRQQQRRPAISSQHAM